MGDEGLDRHCRVAKAAVLAETVMFSVVDHDRQFFPTSLGLPEPYAARGETPLTHSFCQYVVDRSGPLRISDASTDQLVADSLAQRDLGIATYVGVPVSDEDGNVLGALCAVGSTPRQWTDDEVEVLTDISHSIESELRLRNSRRALERRLAGEQLAQEYEHALNQLAQATNRSETIQGVSDELAHRVAPAIGAALTSIGIVDQDELHLTHGSDVTPEIAEAWRIAPVDADAPMNAAVTTGEIVHLEGPKEFADYPGFEKIARSLGLSSFRAIPFGDEGTGLSGALGIGWAEPMPATDVPPAIDRIVELARTTLARAWRFEVERDQARVLERVVLPTSLPDTGLYDVAGLYIAPEAGKRVGGDVYDVLVGADGSVGVLVADAVGHDLMATRAVARLRHAVGVLFMEGYGPGRIMTAVDAYVAASPSRRLVTCVCLHFAADGSSVTIANAGHPQPVLRSAAATRPIGPVGQPLLGRAATMYVEQTIELHPGDLVLAFTDGLIDRRDRSFLDSERWLVDFIEAQPDSDADAVASRLEAELLDAEAEDDLAFLIVSRPHPLEHRTCRWAGPAERVDLAERREEISEWFAVHEPDASIDTVLLVATELLTNARQASDPDSDVSIAVRRTDGEADATGVAAVEVTVTNLSPPFEADTEMPATESVRGRGLAIVDHLARSLDITLEDGLATVRAVVELEQ